MVTRKNLEKIGDGLQFISRLPVNFKDCSNLRVLKSMAQKAKK